MRKITVKGLMNKNWNMVRAIIRKLRGEACELCGSTFQLQVDHCFSRTKKQIFYWLENLTLLCCKCHTAKSYNQSDYVLKVFEHVEDREGSEKFLEMRKIAAKNGPLRDWSKRWYQEEWFEKLNEKMKGLEHG